jgi:3-oxoacyl-[acyl-carrier-protein] synthase II
LISSRLALYNSKLQLSDYDPFRVGVFISSGIGGIKTFEDEMRKLDKYGPRKVSPFLIPSFITNMSSGIVAIDFKARGDNFCITSACASSTHAVGEGFNKIKNGILDIAVVGGCESSISELGFAGFCSMKAMTVNFNNKPSQSSRPFDLKRDGFIMGAGATVLILERLSEALKRKVFIYCEFVNYVSNCDSFHITTPDLTGLSLRTCVRYCIKQSGLSEGDVDYINMHGTSTKYNDIIESNCIQSLIPNYNPCVSSTKSSTGHLLGSAGALEIAICALSIFKNVIPPTINYEFPDPKCSLFYSPNIFLKKKLKTVLTLNLGFGGHNAAILLKKLEI